MLVKPDGVQRGLIGTVIGRIESKGLKIVGLKLIHVSEELAKEHYGEHVDRPFFGDLVSFITSSPVVALAVEGDNAVSVVRTLMGGTNPQEADPGTIRGDFAMTIGMNLVHGSDSVESAERELNLFFDKNEVLDYVREIDAWVIE